jgi:hypothetical protein
VRVGPGRDLPAPARPGGDAALTTTPCERAMQLGSDSATRSLTQVLTMPIRHSLSQTVTWRVAHRCCPSMSTGLPLGIRLLRLWPTTGELLARLRQPKRFLPCASPNALLPMSGSQSGPRPQPSKLDPSPASTPPNITVYIYEACQPNQGRTGRDSGETDVAIISYNLQPSRFGKSCLATRPGPAQTQVLIHSQDSNAGSPAA